MASFESDASGATTPETHDSTRPSTKSWTSAVAHKFKFLSVRERIGHECVFNLAPKIGASDTAVIACSEEYWAVPYVGGGGPVFVSKLDAMGKIEPSNARDQCVNGHKAECFCVAFSPHEPWRMATAGDDGAIVMWDLMQSTGTAMSTLQGVKLGTHRAGAREVCFHPSASCALASLGTDGELALWDAEQSSKGYSFELETAAGSLDFAYDGSLILCCGRDKLMRAVDARQAKVAWQCEPHGVSRSFRAKWIAKDGTVVVSCGPAKRGGREVVLVDTRRPETPMHQRFVDSLNGALLPHYSEETRVLWLWGRGDTTVRHFEVRPEKDDAFTPGLEWRTQSGPHCGVAALPTRCLDIAALEIARFVRLSASTVETVSFTVPRTNELKQYFNDDIYPTEGVRARTPSLSAKTWLAGANATPELISLRPADSPLLSERKVETKVLNTQIVNQRIAEEKSKKEDDVQTYARLQRLANQFEQYQPNKSMGARPGVDAAHVDGDEVADDEWDD